jgi:hypothetical protein
MQNECILGSLALLHRYCDLIVQVAARRMSAQGFSPESQTSAQPGRGRPEDSVATMRDGPPRLLGTVFRHDQRALNQWETAGGPGPLYGRGDRRWGWLPNYLRRLRDRLRQDTSDRRARVQRSPSREPDPPHRAAMMIKPMHQPRQVDEYLRQVAVSLLRPSPLYRCPDFSDVASEPSDFGSHAL